MDFSFGIISYNSQDTIIETLESIRYQVENYGRMHTSYLIICDDCSQDDTIVIIKKWLEGYENLFQEVKLLQTEKNSGICIKYRLMVENISTEHFIPLAGDDLICSENVYDKMATLNEDEVRIYFPISFSGSEININPFELEQHLYYLKKKHTNKRDLQCLETLRPYSSVDVCLLKRHYSKECLNYICNYKNLEDDTSLYYIFKNNKKVKLNFLMEPLVLYRRSEKSLTRVVNSSSQLAFLDDLYKFKKNLFKSECNFFVKIFLLMISWDCFLMKHRFDASKCIDRKIMKFLRNFISRRTRKMKDYRGCLDLYYQKVREQNNYLAEIQKSAKEFLINKT